MCGPYESIESRFIKNINNQYFACLFVCVCVEEEKKYNFVIFIIFKRNPELRIFFISFVS